MHFQTQHTFFHKEILKVLYSKNTINCIKIKILNLTPERLELTANAGPEITSNQVNNISD